jgi:DNA-binding response OmpR family regulator
MKTAVSNGKNTVKTILLVDEDTRTLRTLAQMLREDGFVVEIACDGAAALARLSRDPIPDAVVTNLNVPRADGVSIGRYARARRAEVRVVYVTEHPNLLPISEKEVMTKPVEYAELTRRLGDAGSA